MKKCVCIFEQGLILTGIYGEVNEQILHSLNIRALVQAEYFKGLMIEA
jgi:hypothetical protein